MFVENKWTFAESKQFVFAVTVMLDLVSSKLWNIKLSIFAHNIKAFLTLRNCINYKL